MKVVLLSLFALLFISDAEKHLNGVYLLKSFKYGDATEWGSDNRRKVVKVFKDGYWMCVYFDDHRPNRKLFGGACGGTFEIIDGKYVEGHDFYSWDSTHVGQSTKMDYRVDEKGFEQYGKINSNKYRDYQIVEKFERIESKVTLKDPTLEGVWVLKERYVKGVKEKIEGQYLRIIQYPIIAMAHYDLAKKAYYGATLHEYQFDRNVLSEKCEANSDDSTQVGNVLSSQVSIKGNRLTQKRNNQVEIFQKLK